jgi:hypothetical protein
LPKKYTFLVLLVNFWSFRRAAGEFCSHFYKRILCRWNLPKTTLFWGSEYIFFCRTSADRMLVSVTNMGGRGHIFSNALPSIALEPFRHAKRSI